MTEATTAPEPVRVLVADDQELVRTGFRLILSREPGIEVVADAADGHAAVAAVARSRPDVALMDIRMPGLDGIEATRRIVADPGNRCAVIVLTTFDRDDYLLDALAAGASGFLLKDAAADDLVGAIRTVAAGEAILAPAVTGRVLRQLGARRPDPEDVAAVHRLSAREREVLRLMADGLSNAEIADLLVVGPATVKTHVARVLAKLPARDRVQAVVVAHRSGLAYDALPPAPAR